jgi:hypothetical protein
VRLDRILDRELMQAELPADRIQLAGRRLVQADPHEGVVALVSLVHVVERDV